MTDYEEILITESVSATHLQTKDRFMESVCQIDFNEEDETVGLLESSKPTFHMVLKKISMRQGDQESDLEENKRKYKSMSFYHEKGISLNDSASLRIAKNDTQVFKPIMYDEQLEILLQE